MPIIGTQLAAWMHPLVDDGNTQPDHWPQLLTDISATGLSHIEPTLTSETQVAAIAALAAPRGLKVVSFLAPCLLHEAEWESSATQVLALATVAKTALGCTLVAVDPQSGTAADASGKTDAGLAHQAEAVRWLAGRLDRRGIQLAYHADAAAMHHGAREFHHMMVATRNVAMKLCLDIESIYRGCDRSRLAVKDVITLYGDRVAAVHVRQTSGGVPTEYLSDGDIDYPAIFKLLHRFDFDGPVYLETVRGEATPADLSLVESHRRSLRYLQQSMSRGRETPAVTPRMNWNSAAACSCPPGRSAARRLSVGATAGAFAVA